MGDYESNKVFADNLRKYMDRNGESQAELSAFLGVSQATISFWLSGSRTPKLCSMQCKVQKSK